MTSKATLQIFNNKSPKTDDRREDGHTVLLKMNFNEPEEYIFLHLNHNSTFCLFFQIRLQ